MRKNGPVWVIVALFAISLYSAFFIVDQTESAMVFQFGQLVSRVSEPGLHFKIPVIQKVILFNNRLNVHDAARTEILTADKKTLVVDHFVTWRINEPFDFYQTIGTEAQAVSRLDDAIFNELRSELGRHTMVDIVSESRSKILKTVTERSNEVAKNLGLEVISVRLKRIELPKENEQAVFDRMRTERMRQAALYRAEGQEEALKIRASAEREQKLILAEAYRKSQSIMGQGDAEAARIYARAFNKDPGFYNFVRTLDLYRAALGKKATLYLSKRDELMGLMKDSGVSFPAPLESPEQKPEDRQDRQQEPGMDQPAESLN